MASEKFLSIDIDDGSLRTVIIEVAEGDFALLDARILPLRNPKEFEVYEETGAVNQRQSEQKYSDYLVGVFRELKGALPIKKDYKTLLAIKDKRPRFAFFEKAGEAKKISPHEIHQTGLEQIKSIGGQNDELYNGYFRMGQSKGADGGPIQHYFYFGCVKNSVVGQIEALEKAGFPLAGAYLSPMSVFAAYKWNDIPAGRTQQDNRPPHLVGFLEIGQFSSQMHMIFKDFMTFSRRFDFGLENLIQSDSDKPMEDSPLTMILQDAERTAVTKFFGKVNISLDYLKRSNRYFQVDKVFYLGPHLRRTHAVKFIKENINPQEPPHPFNPLRSLQNRLMGEPLVTSEDDISSLTTAVGSLVLHKDLGLESANLYTFLETERWQKKLKVIGPILIIIVACLTFVGLFGATSFYQGIIEQNIANKKLLVQELKSKRDQMLGESTTDEKGQVKVVRPPVAEAFEKATLAKQNLYDTLIKKIWISIQGINRFPVLATLNEIAKALPNFCFFEHIVMGREIQTLEFLKGKEKKYKSINFSDGADLKGNIHIALVGYGTTKNKVLEVLSFFTNNGNFEGVEIADLSQLAPDEIESKNGELRRIYGLKDENILYTVRFILLAQVKGEGLDKILYDYGGTGTKANKG